MSQPQFFSREEMKKFKGFNIITRHQLIDDIQDALPFVNDNLCRDTMYLCVDKLRRLTDWSFEEFKIVLMHT